MRAILMLLIGAAACVAACKRNDIYSAQSLPARPAVLAAGPPSFVGRWAATAAECTTKAWTLTLAELDAPDGMQCKLDKLSPGSAGFGAGVVCKGAGPETLGRVTLTMSGQGASRGLTLAGGPFPMPVALTACPAG